MLFNWNIDPIAFFIPFINYPVRWYGIFFASGFIVGYLLVNRWFTKHSLNNEDLDSLLMFMFLGTIIGARIGHCFFYEPDFYFAHPLEIFKIWKGGLASHGGGIGLIISVFIFCHVKKYNFLPLADLLCIPTAFEGGVIRIGNFFNSEICGKPTNSDFGVIFDRLNENFPRYPVQLYESISYFVIVLILCLIFYLLKQRKNGFTLGIFFILIFSARLILEFFKPEQADYMDSNATFTVAQYLSIPFIVIGVILVFYSLFSRKTLKIKCNISNTINDNK